MATPTNKHYYAPSGQAIYAGRARPTASSATPVPAVVLQAIVTPVASVSEGSQIVTLEPAWQLIAQLLRDDPLALHKFDPRQFEELLAATYDKAGYDEVVLTPRSGDLGRDVIASKRGWGSIRILDQAKCFAPNHLVTANDVRALVGTLGMDQNASKGIVTTSSDFAPRIESDPFLSKLMPFRLELVNGADLRRRIADLAGKS